MSVMNKMTYSPDSYFCLIVILLTTISISCYGKGGEINMPKKKGIISGLMETVGLDDDKPSKSRGRKGGQSTRGRKNTSKRK